MLPINMPQIVEFDDLVKFSIFITYFKYIFYFIWIVPIYRAAITFKSWKLNYKKYVQIPESSMRSTKTSFYKVAVLIPARNASRYIRSSILSAINQTVTPKTIYILDDASKDETLNVVANLVKELGGTLTEVNVGNEKSLLVYNLLTKSGKDIKIVVVSFKKHSGKPRMINSVLEDVAKEHDYMLILDSDTIIERKYIEKLAYFLSKNENVAGANGTILLWRPEGKGRLSWFFAKAFRNIASLYYLLTVRFSETVFNSVNSLNGSCAMYKVKPLIEVGGIPEDTYVEDTSMSWELQFMGYTVAYLPGAYSYTVDPSSLKRFLSKVYRITLGVQKLLVTRFKRLIAKRKRNLLLTSLYTSLGSLPFVFVIVNVFFTAFLAHFGIYTKGLSQYIFGSLQFTPISLIIAFIYKYPLSYLGISYLTGVLESLAIYMFLVSLYRNEPNIRRTMQNSKSTILIVPLILWSQALIALITIPGSLYHAITKKKVSKW